MTQQVTGSLYSYILKIGLQSRLILARWQGLSRVRHDNNPLVSSVLFMGRLAKLSISEGILKKISLERPDYESVDEKSLSYRLCPEKKESGHKWVSPSPKEY